MSTAAYNGMFLSPESIVVVEGVYGPASIAARDSEGGDGGFESSSPSGPSSTAGAHRD